MNEQDNACVIPVAFPMVNWDALNRASQVATGVHFTKGLDERGVTVRDTATLGEVLSHDMINVMFAITCDNDTFIDLSQYGFKFQITKCGRRKADLFILMSGTLVDYKHLICDLNKFEYETRIIISGIITTFKRINFTSLWGGYALTINGDNTYALESRKT